MKKLVLLAAAAAILAPAAISSASAETASFSVRVGDRGYHSYGQERVIVGHRDRCRTIIIRHKRWDGSVVIRKERRCHY